MIENPAIFPGGRFFGSTREKQAPEFTTRACLTLTNNTGRKRRSPVNPEVITRRMYRQGPDGPGTPHEKNFDEPHVPNKNIFKAPAPGSSNRPVRSTGHQAIDPSRVCDLSWVGGPVKGLKGNTNHFYDGE